MKPYQTNKVNLTISISVRRNIRTPHVCCQNRSDSTRALKVCCGIWHQDVSGRSLKASSDGGGGGGGLRAADLLVQHMRSGSRLRSGGHKGAGVHLRFCVTSAAANVALQSD